MHIELTEQERLRAKQGQPLDVIDPQTNEAYVVIARQRFDQVRSQLPPASLAPENGSAAKAEAPEKVVPEGIRLAQEAYRRDLPELLKHKKLYHQWVAYHRHERIGIAPGGRTLLEECFRRRLPDDEFFVGWIDSCGLIEDEEVEPRRQRYDEPDHEDS